MAVIDVFLEDDDSRPAYADRWERNARESFNALLPAELDAVLKHVRSSDIPEQSADTKQLFIIEVLIVKY